MLVVLFFDTVAAEQKPRIYYYVKDHLGSTRLVIDREKAAEQLEALSNGTSTDYNVKGIVETASYYPFGKQMPGKCATSGVNKRTTEKFTGKELDSDGQIDWNSTNGYNDPGEQGLDLSYFGARYYDAEIGRWVSMDPKEQYRDPYLYSGNAPIMLVDNDGQFAGFAAALAGWYIRQRLTGGLTSEIPTVEKINQVANQALESTARQIGKDLPNGRPHMNEADAFRHITLMKNLSERFGTTVAAVIGFEHELEGGFNQNPAWSKKQKIDDIKMDLYNNRLGRQLAGTNKTPLSAVKSGQASVLKSDASTNTLKEYP